MIRCTGLTKRYHHVAAVSSLDLHVERGELFGFLGPNGAGKTTTIRMLTGLLQPDAGSVEIAGVNIAQDPLAAKAALSFVPDTPSIYEKLTGWELLTFVAQMRRLERATVEERVPKLLDQFELTDRAHDLIGSYSHGMKQKISLVAALLPDPDVVFLDEPTVGLDPKSARRLKDLLRERCDRGKTVFISTHILEIAERMCDRVGIIQGGRLIAQGAVDELRATSHKAAVGAGATLEDLFLELTGGSEYAELAQGLEN